MKIISFMFSLAAIGGIAACGMFGDKKSNKGSGGSIVREDNMGCVQGVVLDGLTGKRLRLKNADDKQGVQVLVRNQLLNGRTHVNGERENANENLLGEYYICGIPLDTDLPIFAWVDGYQNFEGIINIPSTIAERSGKDDIDLNYPTILANIYMYEAGIEAKDLLVRVIRDGIPLKGAAVQLQATGANAIDERWDEAEDRSNRRSFRIAQHIRLTPASGKTNEKGMVKFRKEDLVVGGLYRYLILPPDGGQDATLAKGQISIGYRHDQSAEEAMPYELTISLGTSHPALKIVGRSTDLTKHHERGHIMIWFNQDIELDPASPNYVASVNGCNFGRLSNPSSRESMAIDIKGNRIELRPAWASSRTPKPITDRHCAVTFQANVRAKDATQGERFMSLNESISLFDKGDPALAPTINIDSEAEEAEADPAPVTPSAEEPNPADNPIATDDVTPSIN